MLHNALIMQNVSLKLVSMLPELAPRPIPVSGFACNVGRRPELWLVRSEPCVEGVLGDGGGLSAGGRGGGLPRK